MKTITLILVGLVISAIISIIVFSCVCTIISGLRNPRPYAANKKGSHHSYPPIIQKGN